MRCAQADTTALALNGDEKARSARAKGLGQEKGGLAGVVCWDMAWGWDQRAHVF